VLREVFPDFKKRTRVPLAFVKDNPIPVHLAEHVVVFEITSEHPICCENKIVIEHVLW
jgi:hypothetical protein